MRASRASRPRSPSGRSSTAVGAEPAQRGDDGERAGPGAHQHADAVALAHADLDQALHHAVDAVLDLALAVRPVAEQEADLVGVAAGLLVEQQPEADPGGRVEALDALQPRQSAPAPR